MIANDAFNINYIEHESKTDKDKSIEGYLDMIIPYLDDTINNHKNQREWKIKLSIVINFISSKHFDEIRILHTKSNNIEIILGIETDEII